MNIDIRNYYYNIKSLKSDTFNLTSNELWNNLFPITKYIEQENFYIKGKELNKNNNDIYYILKCDTNDKIKNAIIFFLLYLLYSKNTNYKAYLGIDLEYNNYDELKKKHPEFKYKTGRETALIQICCDLSYINKSFIIIINPSDIINNNLYHKIVISLLCSPAIKILHGGDGLDIPYLYSSFLKEKKYIINFTKNLYDTKFLCDYLNIVRQNKTKCNIYSFLYNENIINETKLNELLENENKMGKIQYLYVNIKNMSNEFTKYSIYDVIYLDKLLIKILEYNSPDIDQVMDMTRLTYLVRKKIINLYGKKKEGNAIIGKIEYFQKIYKQLISNDKNKDVIIKIGYNSLLQLF